MRLTKLRGLAAILLLASAVGAFAGTHDDDYRYEEKFDRTMPLRGGRVNVDAKFGIKFDYSMDANGHPQVIYCRSDHYEYARYGIPIAFFTTGGHADYHMVTDEPQYIDYDRLSLVSNFVKALATRVANLDHRLVVD